jgi:2-keto-4-pentenoate hydratase/2-oxohepta-3-ene-1,7-dioic acid hydratase in catechol pathway
MKLISFVRQHRPGFGAVVHDEVVDLTGRGGHATLKALIAADGIAAARDYVAAAAPDFALASVNLLPVIPDPDKILCVGMNYHDHIVETGREVTEKPSLFPRFAGSQVGHGQAIVKPPESDQLDYEGELALVIGKSGRRIDQADALDHVAGYACYNDASIRDWQRHTTQFMPGKNWVATGGFGPWLVTADEILDPAALTLVTRLNGHEVQRTSTGLMIVPIPMQIAYISTFIDLLPGDVIVTGTPGGVGARRTPPLFMRDGDVVEVEIERIGILRNPVMAE